MTDEKTALPELFAYGKDDTKKENEVAAPFQIEEKPTYEGIEKKSQNIRVFPFISFGLGILAAAIFVRYVTLPESLLTSLTSAAKAFSDAFYLNDLIADSVFTLTAKLSGTDLVFFSLLFFSPFLYFSKIHTAILLFCRTFFAFSALGITYFYVGERASFVALASILFSSAAFLIGAFFTASYTEKLKNKDLRLKVRLCETLKYIVLLFSLFGLLSLSKALLIIIANTIH